MHFRIELDGDVTLIHPVGNMDGGRDCAQLQELVDELTEAGCRKVAFSFSLTRWINSCGVGKIIAAKFTIENSGGHFVLCDLNPRNMTVINTLRLDQFFEIHETLNEATKSLKQDAQTPVAK